VQTTIHSRRERLTPAEPIQVQTKARYLSVVIPVYRDAERAAKAATAMRSQRLPDDVTLQVIIVDDGSGDGTFEHLQSLELPGADLLALPENQGRSAVRNAGALAAKGEIVVFMDCDCVPVESGFLAAHHAAFADQSVVAGTGHVTGLDDGFWSRYQTVSSHRRERQHAQGDVYAGSSQNLSVRKSIFDQVGGFDTNYKEYGFEDRDLLIRLSAAGRVTWVADATVRHCDELRMAAISRKMVPAGTYSAARFASLHPRQYRSLGYATLDARLHPMARLGAWLVGPLLPWMASSVDWCIARPRLPFGLVAAFAKVVIGLSFMVGTARPGNHSLDNLHRK